METQLLEHFRRMIGDRLQALEKEEKIAADNRSTVTLDQQSVGRLSRMDALQQQAMAMATHKRRATERAALQMALARLEEGEFGFCEDCGEEIPVKRLELNPSLRLCIDCARG